MEEASLLPYNKKDLLLKHIVFCTVTQQILSLPWSVRRIYVLTPWILGLTTWVDLANGMRAEVVMGQFQAVTFRYG